MVARTHFCGNLFLAICLSQYVPLYGVVQFGVESNEG